MTREEAIKYGTMWLKDLKKRCPNNGTPLFHGEKVTHNMYNHQ